MNILRVDMKREEISFKDMPEDWKLIGGRGLIAKIGRSGDGYVRRSSLMT